MELARLAAALTGQAKDKVMAFQRHIQGLVRDHVRLLLNNLSEDALSKLIAGSPAGQVRGDGGRGKYVIVVYDLKVSGNASTPHRPPGWCKDHHGKLVSAAMLSRTECADELHSGDLYVFFNGGKRGVNGAAGKNVAGHRRHEKRQGFIFYTEESMVARLNKAKTTEVKQEEGMLLITKLTMVVSGRKRRHFAGSNRGTSLAFVTLPMYSEQSFWKLPAKEKEDIFETTKPGKAQLDTASTAVQDRTVEGGRAAGKAETPPTVPVFYHAMPRVVAEELIHSHDAPAVIDLTAADGTWALACIRNRIPYAGVVFTPWHEHALATWLEMQVLASIQDENDPLYEPSFLEALSGASLDKSRDVNLDGRLDQGGKVLVKRPRMATTDPADLTNFERFNYLLEGVAAGGG